MLTGEAVPANPADVREVDDTPGAGTWAYDFVAENENGTPGARADVTQTMTVP